MSRLLGAIVLLSGITYSSHLFADCFVTTNSGNIRSGPGTNYEIIGTVEKWQVIDLAYSTCEKGWIILDKVLVVDSQEKEEGWTTAGPDRSMPAIGEEASVFDLNREGKKLRGSGRRGLILQYLGEEKVTRVFFQGAVRPVTYHKALYRPIVKNTYISCSLGKIIKGSYPDVARRANAVKMHETWPQSVKNRIMQGEIKLGMTPEQVTASWGSPDDINRQVGSRGVHEQWVYGDTYYLHFQNGVLTSWTEH